MTLRKLLLLLIGLVLAACNLPSAESGTSQAWIDAPLDGSTLPLAPYEIIFHAAAASGNPAALELTINGQPVTLSSTNLGGPLVTARYDWNPQDPGVYNITARTRDSHGNWSSPHTHVVAISGPTITVTPVITMTVSPTPAVTVTVSPMPAAQATITLLGASTDHFYFGASTCGPTSITLEAEVSDSQQVHDVLLFFKLRDKDSGNYTDWSDGTDMSAEGNGKFTITLMGNSIAAGASGNDWLIYQFVGTGPDNKSVARTQVYSDISFSRCGRGIFGVPPG